MPSYFLVKSEPTTYSFDDLVRDKSTRWDGVRNFEARNNLRAMKQGDLLLYYHSGEAKAVVGIAKVAREAYDDPSAEQGDWSAVDVVPVKLLMKPVTLAAIRSDAKLEDVALIKRPRLSVVPVSSQHFSRILELGRTAL
jgi:predicted RNA-binding protein with PUA-like domain